MKVILLLFIKCYWVVIPKNKRRKCLFKTSCSHYVYQQTKVKGFQAGLRALQFRIQNCHPQHQIIDCGDEKILITKTNKIVREGELSDFVLKKSDSYGIP